MDYENKVDQGKKKRGFAIKPCFFVTMPDFLIKDWTIDRDICEKKNLQNRPVFLRITTNNNNKGHIAAMDDSVTYGKLLSYMADIYLNWENVEGCKPRYSAIRNEYYFEESIEKCIIDVNQLNGIADRIRRYDTEKRLEENEIFVCPVALLLNNKNPIYANQTFIGESVRAILFAYVTANKNILNEYETSIYDFQEKVKLENIYTLTTNDTWQESARNWVKTIIEILKMNIITDNEIMKYREIQNTQ